jgi:hypothetical protein
VRDVEEAGSLADGVVLGEVVVDEVSCDIDDVSAPAGGTMVLSVVTPVLGLVVGFVLGFVLVVSYPPELGGVVLVVS